MVFFFLWRRDKLKKEFLKEFMEIRDSMLDDIKENEYNYNKFINYWSKILDKYSVDNVLNLYHYNPYGKTFMTFDEWNSEKIDRRIKPKSKGIPILDNKDKIYVFEIRQTYGKEYDIWNYNHLVDDMLLDYYNNKYDINNDKNISINNQLYNVFYKITKEYIVNNYIDLKDDEVELIAKTMTPLLLSKNSFNINDLPNGYEYLNKLRNEDILKCMQIINKETSSFYNDFEKNAISLREIQNDIQNNLLNQYKNNKLMSNEEKEKYLDLIQMESGYNYEILDNAYKEYEERYKYYFPNRNNVSMYIRTNDLELEQTSLFTPREDELANKICNIFNSFDTKYQNTFDISNVELQAWEHISSKKRNLTILLKSSLINEFADSENSFTYFNNDKTGEIKLNDCLKNNAFIQSLYKDKDFSISFTPNMIHIYWHNFDDKQFDLSIPSTKVIDESELDSKELDIIDEEVSSITDEIDTNIIEYPKINYHISDDKVDHSFGAKSRFEDNIKAIEILKELEHEDRFATLEEQDILSRYVGWGGIADVFDERKDN